MTKKRKFISLLPLLLPILFIALVAIILYWNRNNMGELGWEFKGPVQEAVNDGDAGSASYVKVQGKGYDLTNIEWADFIKIFKGDTLIKRKGDKYIKIIRAGAKDTIYYNKEYKINLSKHLS